jgi:hypothetical protein
MLNAPFTIAVLARGRAGCHRPPMNRPPRNFTRAGGSLLAISIIVGTVAGTIARQSNIGFFVGLGAGLVMLAYIFVADWGRSADPAPRPDDAADHHDR